MTRPASLKISVVVPAFNEADRLGENLQRIAAFEMVCTGFSFDVELLWLARRRDAKIQEVPVSWKNEPHSTVRPLIDPLWMLIEILQFRVHHAYRPQIDAAPLSRERQAFKIAERRES